MNLQEQISRIHEMMRINKGISPWLLRRFHIDELNKLIEDVNELIEYGTDIESAIYDAVREFIKEKNFSDVDEFGNEESYWESYLRYEEPLVNYVKERLESGKEEMREGEITERCWKGYTQKGMKTMFGKRYPNCVKKTK